MQLVELLEGPNEISRSYTAAANAFQSLGQPHQAIEIFAKKVKLAKVCFIIIFYRLEQ